MYSEEDQSPLTLGEIYDQARSCAETVRRAGVRSEIFNRLLPLDSYTDIIITGCGSSHNLAMCASFAWSETFARPVAAIAASELLNFASHYLKPESRPLVIAITRSGGTTEVKLAVERLKRDYNARALAITGETGGTVAAVCDAEIAFDECYEQSVVMTQAFTCMLVGLYLLADGAAGHRYFEEISRIPDLINGAIRESEEIFRAMAEDGRIERFFFLGSGMMKGLADECALKMTEMALATAISHRALEFRHGPKATLNENDQVILFPVEAERQHVATLVSEIESTGARSLVVASPSLGIASDEECINQRRDAETHFPDAEMGRHGDAATEEIFPASPRLRVSASDSRAFTVGGEVSEMFRPALYAHAGQLLAYWRAAARDMNPDAPPHLARTVLLDV